MSRSKFSFPFLQRSHPCLRKSIRKLLKAHRWISSSFYCLQGKKLATKTLKMEVYQKKVNLLSLTSIANKLPFKSCVKFLRMFIWKEEDWCFTLEKWHQTCMKYGNCSLLKNKLTTSSNQKILEIYTLKSVTTIFLWFNCSLMTLYISLTKY